MPEEETFARERSYRHLSMIEGGSDLALLRRFNIYFYIPKGKSQLPFPRKSFLLLIERRTGRLFSHEILAPITRADMCNSLFIVSHFPNPRATLAGILSIYLVCFGLFPDGIAIIIAEPV